MDYNEIVAQLNQDLLQITNFASFLLKALWVDEGNYNILETKQVIITKTVSISNIIITKFVKNNFFQFL